MFNTLSGWFRNVSKPPPPPPTPTPAPRPTEPYALWVRCTQDVIYEINRVCDLRRGPTVEDKGGVRRYFSCEHTVIAFSDQTARDTAYMVNLLHPAIADAIALGDLSVTIS